VIRLYQGSGAGDIVFVSKVNSSLWDKYRLLTLRLLKAQGKIAAAEVLEEYPFVLNEGTNCFGDEFHYLTLTLLPDDYVRIGEQESIPARSFVYKAIADAIGEIGSYYIRFIVIDIDHDERSRELVESPILPTTVAKVTEALSDAEELLRSRLASSAVDRLHTAFHGYLQEQCRINGIPYNPSDSITTLFKNLRQNHQRLKEGIEEHAEVKRVCNCLSSIIDSLNPVRNHLSRAHPNEKIIGEDEALLVVNTVRTMFHYLNAKL